MRILEVVTEHTGPFKTLIEVLKDLLPEVNIEFTNDKIKGEVTTDRSGMKIIAVDTTKTVLINLKLNAENFSKFVCKKKKLVIGVNLTFFHKLIKSMDKEDNLSLYINHDEPNNLRINIESSEKKSHTYYKLKLMDLGTNPIKIPPLKFEAFVKMNAQEFHKLCREMNGIADYVEIKCLRNKIIFTCKGEFAERKTVYSTKDGGDIVNIQHTNSDDGPEIIQGVYELRNLVLFGKCGNLCNYIEIYMKNNFPLVIKYMVATLGKIHLLLTPTNEDDVMNANYSDEDVYYSEEELEYIDKGNNK